MTILGAVGMLAGSKTPKAPTPAIPAAPIEDATEETGADIILGGELTDDETLTKKKATTATTSGSGLSINSSTGINIL
jgi:hypothetical protein